MRLSGSGLAGSLERFPRVQLGYAATPIEKLPNLSADLGFDLLVKRDDCSPLLFGGNKVRQLEFYLGRAVQRGADVVLITGAVQSNFVRTTAAMAAKLGLRCHVQLEQRVQNQSERYRTGGNVFLNKLLGATVHSYPDGEDESGADRSLDAIAGQLKQQGANPYVIHLGLEHPPWGALGYVAAALEFATQLNDIEPVDVIYIPSGSALTHCGLLYGLRSLGILTPVRGVCVRREKSLQQNRVSVRLQELADMLSGPVPALTIDLNDSSLAPGYGVMSDETKGVVETAARSEGLIVDPVYSAKTLGAIFNDAEHLRGKRVLFWHTGGQAALFAYQDAFAYE